MANRHNITFNTEAEYNAFKASSGYVTPNVSYIKEINGVHYNPYVDPYAGHDYVDLGLPSGTKWATMNIGANSITDYGNYYKYGHGASQYNNDQTVYSGTENPLAASADSATQVWGGAWHMPTSAQCDELTANTTYQWVTDYQGSGVNGATFTANGQTLFIPAAGYWYDGNQREVGTYGYIWSSTPSETDNYAYDLYFKDDKKKVSNTNRNSGFSVRGVVD